MTGFGFADGEPAEAKNDPSIVPKEAKSTKELIESIKTRFKATGEPREWAEFAREGRRLFAFWYPATSGLATCRLHVYQYEPAKERWVLHLEKLFREMTTISVELPPSGLLIVRDAQGTVIFNEEEKKEKK
jgi:hypothetical protein